MYYLRAMGPDHHSRFIAGYLPDLLSQGVRFFTEYIESRAMSNNFTESITREIINE